jgi:hypothetical protein
LAYDIIVISYDEPTADRTWNYIKTLHPFAKRVHGVKGIANAHREAARISNTKMLYVVDGDAEPLQSFDFKFVPPTWDQHYVHIWKSRNPANGLEYGYGGIKLFPKKVFRNTTTSVDFSTSIGQVKYVDEVGCITHFNSDEFGAWRGAFRECAKLAAAIHTNSHDEHAVDRLNTWLGTDYSDVPFGEYVKDGAARGGGFGITSSEKLSMVNDFDWLRTRFDSIHGC